jgi:predicted aminopeptidase
MRPRLPRLRSHPSAPLPRQALAAAALLLLTSCFPARYLTQAVAGQAGLLLGARPIPDVLGDARVPGHVRAVLGRVEAVQAYGESKGLARTGNYRRYTHLERGAAVWVVLGCEPLSFTQRTWSFPVVGSVPYLGFFSEADAQAYAREVARGEELDVAVRPAGAYSTLGWFRDPVLSTMIPEGEEALGELANVVLHESVHATVYVPGQSALNESLASFVADRLTLPFLVRTLGAEAPGTRAWAESLVRDRRRIARMQRAYRELDALYTSGAPDAEKRAGKARLLEGLRADLGLKRAVNNATLAGFRTYGSGTAGFERLLAACGRRWPAFLGAVRSLTPRDFARPQQEDFEGVLDALAARGCGG